MEKKWTFQCGSDEIHLAVGRYAQQANGSVMVRSGDTVVLVTATMSDPRPGVDFLPLMVNFEERVYAIGRIPGSWNRREGRPRDLATLNARLIDRPLRPLFPEGFRHDVQVIATVLSVDPDHHPEILSLIGASAALMISDIPFNNPIGGVKVGLVDGELVINPNEEEQEKSDLELIVSGTEDAVTMVEAGANEVKEEVILEAIELGHKEIQKQVEVQKIMVRELGVEKIEFVPATQDEQIVKRVKSYENDLDIALREEKKQAREEAIKELKEQIVDLLVVELAEEGEEEDVVKEVKKAFESMLKDLVRRMILHEDLRPDGRRPEEIRPIWTEAGLLPRVHGSAVFTRGQTQALAVLTLGAVGDEQIMFDLGAHETKRFLHHYNFPPYSVGETFPLRTPGRREIGHGALGEKALEPIIPSHEEFPYTIRLVSEILESNGSTSQASICAGSMALMDGGVPIKSHVAGVAMGLMKDGDTFAVLSDIQGMEDFYGDMDFKVAGTKDGVTALQMDMKISGIDKDILWTALERAKHGRFHILQEMEKGIKEPRPELSPYAPTMVTLKIDPEQIRDIIGPQGKTIRHITEVTNTKVDIEDDGTVFILAYAKEDVEKAVAMVEELTRDVEVGQTYLGKVKRLMNFGAFVEVLPGKEGLVHISRLADFRVNKVEDIINVGDQIWVKVTEIDDRDRINLSREAVLKERGQEILEEENRNPKGSSNDSSDSNRRSRSNRNHDKGRGGRTQKK